EIVARAIEAQSCDEMVAQAEEIAGVRELARRAVRVGVRRLPVELRVRAPGEKVGNRDPAGRRADDPVVAAKQSRSIVAWRDVGGVAVDHRLMKVAVVSQGLEGSFLGNVEVAGSARGQIAVRDLIRSRELRPAIGLQ